MKIAIIGAGPVGLFSAICLAQDKHEIHLYEKSTLPVDKACGEGLLHLGVTLLKKYDIDIKKTKPIRGLNFYSPKGHLKKASFLDSTGLGIRRLHLSESLLKYVKKYPNITLFERTKIDHPLKDYDFTIYATGASKDGMKKIYPIIDWRYGNTLKENLRMILFKFISPILEKPMSLLLIKSVFRLPFYFLKIKFLIFIILIINVGGGSGIRTHEPDFAGKALSRRPH